MAVYSALEWLRVPCMNATVRLMFGNRTWGQVVAKNAAWIFVGEGVSRVLKLAVTMLVVRQFGPEDFGRFTFAFAVATMAAMAFDAGMVTVVTREYARDSARVATLPGMMGLKAVVGAIVMVVTVGVAFVVTADRTVTYMIVVLALSLFFGEAVNLAVAVFRARQRMELETVLRAIGGTLLFSVVAGALMPWLGPWAINNVADAYLIASAGAFALAMGYMAGTGVPVGIRFRPREWAPVLRAGLPIALGGAATILYVNMDQAMLGWYGRFAEAGWYGVATRVNGVAVVPMSVMALVLFPALSSLQGPECLRRWRQWAKWSAAAGVVVAVTIAALADPLVRLAFGPEFVQAAGVLRVTVIGYGLLYAYFPWMQRLVIEGRQATLLYVVAGAAILNFALNAALIPHFGMYGAAWATVATHAVIFGALVMAGRWHLPSSRS